MRKDGIPFANMTIAPPTGKSFANKEVILTFEAVKNTDRKYAKSQKEESAVFRVSCPVINYEKVVLTGHFMELEAYGRNYNTGR